MGLKPTYIIRVDGSDRTEIFRGRQVTIGLTDETGYKSDEVSITVDNYDFSIEPPRRGVVLDVDFGYEGKLANFGEMTVDSVSKSYTARTIVIKAKGFDTRGRLKERKTRSFDVDSLGDLVQKIAEENGFSSLPHPQTFDFQIVKRIVQQKESDLNLATRYAKQFDCIFRINGKNLLVQPKGLGETFNGRELPVIPIDRSQCDDAVISYEGRENFGSVEAKYKGYEDGKFETVRVGDGDPVFRLPKIYDDEPLARGAARAKLQDFRYAGVSFNITIEGDPFIIAEMYVELTGFDSEDNGRWLIQRASHSLSSSSFTTSLTLQKGLQT